MAQCSPEALEKKYISWIKAQLAFLFTKQGLEPFVCEEIKQFQQKCLLDICERKGLPNGTICTSCHTENVVQCPTSTICNAKNGKCSYHRNSVTKYTDGCPNNICFKFKSEISSTHRYLCPSFKNTDATKWCTNPWEVAKCFMPPDIYKGVTSAAETDFNGIASVIINHKGFQEKIKEELVNRENIFEKARVTGNDLRHSSNLQLETSELYQCFTQLKNLLSLPGSFQTDQHIVAARKKLLQLEYDTLVLNKADIQKILNDADKDVSDRLGSETDKQNEVERRNLELITVSKKLLEGNTHEMLSSTQLEKILGDAVAEVYRVKNSAGHTRRDERVKKRPEPFVIESDKSLRRKANIVINQPEREFSYIFLSAFENFSKKRAEYLYHEMRKGLKEDLIKWYRANHSSMRLSPLCDELETPLLSLYILPEMYCFDIQTIVGSEIRASVDSLTDVFWTVGREKVRKNKEIYMVADAGCGKTAFVKYLTLAWCQAHCPDPELDGYFIEEDLKQLRAFELLFLVLLRDSLDICSVDDMILKNVITKLPIYSLLHINSIRELLNNEKTLVLLDGLDEWIHPETGTCRRTRKQDPHRTLRDHCTILTTLSQWKLSNISLKNSEVDNRIEIKKLSKKNIRKLAKRAILKLQPLEPTKTESLLALLDEKITQNDTEDLMSNPLLLLHLACLFYKDPSTAHSKSEICSSILNLCLARTLKKPGPKQLCEPVLTDIPHCFREKDQSEKYDKLVMTIGKLAFHTLFSENQSNKLIFKDKFVKDYLCPEDLRMGLLTGILSEVKVTTLIRQYSNISFPQKMLQEYLCAKYLSCQSIPGIEETILTGCKSIQNILDMSTVCGIVSDLNKDILSYMSLKLMHVINEDDLTQNYRTRAYCDKMYSDPLNDIQNMFLACLKDTPEDSENNVCFQDLFVCEDDDLKQLAALLKQNKDMCDIHLKSVFIDNTDSSQASEIIALLAQSDLSNLQKLFYRGWSIDENLAGLLVDKLKCLTLICETKICTGVTCSLSPSLCMHIVSLQHLESVCIMNITMRHEALEAIFDMVSNMTGMFDIRLQNLTCADHDVACQGFNLNLSRHVQLKRLGFGDIPLSQLSVNVLVLEECHVGKVSKPRLVTACLQKLQVAEILQIYVCNNLASLTEVETMRQTLSSLVNVKQVALNGIDLGEGSLTLSPEMGNIEVIQLCRVTISVRALQDIVKALDNISQPVTVLLQNCVVVPEIEFKYFRKYMSSSGKYILPIDDSLPVSEDTFAFKTIRQTDE